MERLVSDRDALASRGSPLRSLSRP